MSDDSHNRALPGVKPTWVNPSKITGQERVLLLALYPYPQDIRRPTKRGDCVDGGFNSERPCRFVSCRHHLAVDVTPAGSVHQPFGETDVDDMPETCSLDVADRAGPQGLTLSEVGFTLNLTRERARQIEFKALRRLRRGMAAAGFSALDDDEST